MNNLDYLFLLIFFVSAMYISSHYFQNKKNHIFGYIPTKYEDTN